MQVLVDHPRGDCAPVRPARPGLLPPGALRIGPGKALACLMVVSDVLALGLAFALGAELADLIRWVLSGQPAVDRGLFGPRSDILPVLVGLMVGVFGFGGLYQRDGWETEEVRRLIAGIALVALVDAALAHVSRDPFSRLWFATAWPLAMGLIITQRMVLRAVPRVARLMTAHLVVIGTGIDPGDFAFQLRESRSGPVRVREGLPLEVMAGLSPHDLEVWLDGMALGAGVQPGKLHCVIVPGSGEVEAARILSERLSALGRPFFVALSYDGLARRGLSLHMVVGSDLVLAGLTPEPFPWVGRALKRLFDISLAGAGALLLSPLMAAIAVALMFEGGPVFFTQIRVGRDRRRFECLKFRSMWAGAEARLDALLARDPAAHAEWQRHQKLSRDPRITPVGRFLRTTSLDELPQIFNVLRGDMSLVGPRPIVAPEVPGYASDHAYYASPEFRHYARCVPGITGLWQVSGRHCTTHDERVRLDRWYARNRSIWLDLAILLKTFRAVVGRSGG